MLIFKQIKPCVVSFICQSFKRRPERKDKQYIKKQLELMVNQIHQDSLLLIDADSYLGIWLASIVYRKKIRYNLVSAWTPFREGAFDFLSKNKKKFNHKRNFFANRSFQGEIILMKNPSFEDPFLAHLYENGYKHLYSYKGKIKEYMTRNIIKNLYLAQNSVLSIAIKIKETNTIKMYSIFPSLDCYIEKNILNLEIITPEKNLNHFNKIFIMNSYPLEDEIPF